MRYGSRYGKEPSVGLGGRLQIAKERKEPKMTGEKGGAVDKN